MWLGVASSPQLVSPVADGFRFPAPSTRSGEDLAHRLRALADRAVAAHKTDWLIRRVVLALLSAAVMSVELVLVPFTAVTLAVVALTLGTAGLLVAATAAAEHHDCRRVRRWHTTEPMSLGLVAAGGWGCLPAVPPAAVNADTFSVVCDPAAFAQLDFTGWLDSRQLSAAQREVFEALAPEFEGTFADLVAVSRALG